MLEMSSGLVDRLASTDGFGLSFLTSFVYLYNGVRPATADDPPTGQLLGVIQSEGSTDPAYLQFALHPTEPGVIIPAAPMEVRADVTGVPTWFRLSIAGWHEGYSTYVPRLDGDVGADLILPTIPIVAGMTYPVQDFRIQIAKRC